MKRDKKRHITALVLAGIFLLFAGVSYGLMHEQTENPVTRGIQSLFFPVRQWINRTGRGAFAWVDSVINAKQIKEEKELLQQTLSGQQQEIDRAEYLEQENRRLRNLLDFQNKADQGNMIGCEVVSKNAGSGFLTLQIDKGTAQGISVGDPAVSHYGLVGTITEAGTNWATVTTILHPQNAVAVLVVRTEAMATVQGNLMSAHQGTLTVAQKFTDEPFSVGDVFVTNGMGGIYPKGYLVGTVTSIEKEDANGQLQVTVTPTVEFETLYAVTIIKQQTGG